MHRHAHADDAAGSQCERNQGTSRKVNQMAAVRQLTSGGYLVQVSETELALIKTALSGPSGCRASGWNSWTGQTTTGTAGAWRTRDFGVRSKLSRSAKLAQVAARNYGRG